MNNNKKFFEEKGKLAVNKKIIAFDLDGTLALSKMPVDKEMAKLFKELLSVKIVAVIGGGSYSLFKDQFLFSLNCSDKNLLKNLLLLPTSGSTFCQYKNNKWDTVYKNILTEEEIKNITDEIMKVFDSVNNFIPDQIYGPRIEDRKTEVTFSALGMQAPLEKRKNGIKNMIYEEKW